MSSDSHLPLQTRELLASFGAETSSRKNRVVVASPASQALPGPPWTWWWVEPADVDRWPGPRRDVRQAILTAEEQTRESIEQSHPETIGHIWTVGEEGPNLGQITARYFPAAAGRFHLGVIGYNLKFLRPILAQLVLRPGISAAVDEWRTFAAGASAATDRVLDECDVILCEWCGPNAVYASQRVRADQRLIVRLHRFELDTEYWQDIDVRRVHTIVTVGDHYRKRVLDVTGWPADKVITIPNHVDDLQLARPKVRGARFNLGFLGASSSRKRLDLALDLIAQLREHDPRFHLMIKSARPENEKWVWDDPAERDYFSAIDSQLASVDLRNAVTWDEFGLDVAAWMRRVGFVLSLSDDESFHLAPAEGMASGAVPVIRNWPGASSIYSDEWILSDRDSMAQRIQQIASDRDNWATISQRAQQQARDSFAFDSLVAKWLELLARSE